MGSIMVNVSSVLELSPQIKSAKTSILNTKTACGNIRHQIDGAILERRNIRNRMNSAFSQLSSLESRIQSISGVVENGVNYYSNTDKTVVAWQRAMTGNVIGLGNTTYAGASKINTEDAKQSMDKMYVNLHAQNDSLAEKILKDDWKVEKAVLEGTATVSGELLGFESAGTAQGDVIGGSIETKSQTSWGVQQNEEGKIDYKTANIGIEKSIEAEGHIAQGKLNGNVGWIGGQIQGSVGNVGATGAVGITLFEEGKLSPQISAKAKADASTVKGNAEVKLGTDNTNVHIAGSGVLLGAEAEASGSVGVIKDNKGKNIFGVQGKVGAEAYLAQGTASGGFSVFGIKIDAGISGKAGSAGIGAEGKATTGGVSGEISAGLGFGLGLEISIDWSDFGQW